MCRLEDNSRNSMMIPPTEHFGLIQFLFSGAAVRKLLSPHRWNGIALTRKYLLAGNSFGSEIVYSGGITCQIFSKKHSSCAPPIIGFYLFSSNFLRETDYWLEHYFIEIETFQIFSVISIKVSISEILY